YAHINVGTRPLGIGVDELKDRIYVANYDNDTASVIDGKNNIKIKDIPVGNGPIGIGVYREAHRVYVANCGNEELLWKCNGNTVCVSDTLNNSKIGKDIPVGRGPVAIGVDSFKHRIYVVNKIDNTVSVINGTKDNNTKIGKDIPVGRGPVAISVWPYAK